MKFNVKALRFLLFPMLLASLAGSGQSISFGDSSDVVILVRLKTEHKRINYLEAAGRYDEASGIREAVNTENNLTIEAFRKSLTCCQYRFFYDTSSRAISFGVYDGVFVSSTGESTQANFPDSVKILIAEFGSPYSETFGTESGFGLIIYDKAFNQMKKPFPYYVTTVYGLVSRKEAVARFDRKLYSYLARYRCCDQ